MSTLFEKTISTKQHKKYRVNVERYNSAMEVVEHCKTRQITNSEIQDKSKEAFGSWEGVKTYEEALDLLKNGYQPTVDNLKDTLKANKTGNAKRISFANDIQGFAPIVPLALKGIPQSMVNMTMKPIKAKVIDVYYDMTCSAITSSQEIIENGQKLLGTIIALEHQGYKFNLYAVQTYCSDKNADMLIVKVKDSSKPIDLKRISFPLTHTAFFRVIGFDWYSRTPKGTYRCNYGRAMSYVFESQSERNEFAKQMFGDNAVLLNGNIIRTDEEHLKGVLTNAKSKN